MSWTVERMRAWVVVVVGLGAIAAGCGYHSGSSAALMPADIPGAPVGNARCVSPGALGVRAGAGTRTVVVKAGAVVTLQLVEPEAYASSMSGPPPSAFPWLSGRSSDATGLWPVAICPKPPVVMSLPVRLFAFRAITPGRYRITAALNPAYHVPQMQPPLRRLHPVRVNVVVDPRPLARSSSTSRRYTVTASVLDRPGMATPHACLTYLVSLPPAGCGGVPVVGYDFERLPGVVHYGRMGWQTSELRMVGVWDGDVLRLTRPPFPVPRPTRVPVPPIRCRGRSTPHAVATAKRVTRAHARLNLLELVPCGRRVWVLVAVADSPTRAFIQHHFGRGVVIAGWLRSGGRTE